ncbi:hypothetical protein [Saccharicrinis fermentans]|uniref:Uncharacterized protein n=1 Tax=Saccharicrinis fermentans DSM 9555 = JCM 21142 TaxID=869213 RepID=W7YCV9_9BACT|nr:hypothetical protein [Saccharicrinis fermentans]GAF02286.1 hypothetical protein JCM21142_3915 [Saccharicrinis fermentans DSM 9555 = JCM 21142]
MKYCLMIMVSSFCFSLYAQVKGTVKEVHETSFEKPQHAITLKYYSDKKALVIDKPFWLKKNTEYTVFIEGVNSAIVKQQFHQKSFFWVSERPKILETIFPMGSSYQYLISKEVGDLSAPESMNAESTCVPKSLSSLIEEAIIKYQNLMDIKQGILNLYESTAILPNMEMAVNTSDTISILLGGKDLSDDEFAMKIKEHHLFVKTVEELYAAYLSQLKPDCVSKECIRNAILLRLYVEEIEGVNYAKLLAFLKASKKAKEKIMVSSFKADKDLVELDVKLMNTFTGDTLADNKIVLDTYGGWSFDFSTGFMMNSLINKAYALKSLDDARYEVIEEDGSEMDFGFGGLGHLTYKYSPCFKVGIATGASLSLYDGNLRYLLGPTVLFGKRNKLSMTGGLSFAKLEQLSASVTRESDGTHTVPITAESIPTYHKLKTGWFVSVSYVIVSKK